MHCFWQNQALAEKDTELKLGIMLNLCIIEVTLM